MAKNVLKLRENDKATFFSLTNEWIVPAASTIKPEEREFVVDSEARMHIVSKRDLNSAELETMRIFEESDDVPTAKCIPAVLSLGKLCEDNGYSYEWTSGQKPQRTKNGRRIQCNTDNYVPIVVRGLSTRSSSSTASTSPTSQSEDTSVEDSTPSPATIRRRSTPSRVLGDQLRDSEKQKTKLRTMRDLPKRLEDFTEKLEDEGVSVSRDTPVSTSRKSDSEPWYRSNTASSLTSRKTDLRSTQENQDFAPCRKRTGNPVPRAENFGESITAGHKVLSEGCDSRKNHR